MDFESKVGVGIFGVWLLWALFCLSVTAGLVYAAFHFISKFW